jgi:uncharacterized Zn-finger protein
METHDDAHGSDHQELSEAVASGQSFVPGAESIEPPLLGETSSEGAANWQSYFESEEVASDVGLPMGDQEMQLENPTPSTSRTVAGPERQKKRKREEEGKCDECKKWFKRKSDAKRHKKAVHEKEIFVCPWPRCNTRCSRRDALRRHMQDQHNTQLEDNSED